MKSRLVSETNMTPCLLFISCLAHIRRNRTFIFNHSVVYRCFCKDSHFTLQRHTTSKHVFKFTCVTTLVVWVSDCCWKSDDLHSVLCLNASCVNPDRQRADPPLIRTDSVTHCDMKGLQKRKHSDQALREPWGTNKEMFILVYFLILIQLVFCFWRFFFFCQNILVSVFSRVKLCLIFPLLWNWQGKCVKLSEKHLHEKVFWYSVCKK